MCINTKQDLDHVVYRDDLFLLKKEKEKQQQQATETLTNVSLAQDLQ